MNWFKSFFRIYPIRYRVVFEHQKYRIQCDRGSGGRKWQNEPTIFLIGSICIPNPLKVIFDDIDQAIEMCEFLNKPPKKVTKIVYPIKKT